MSDDLENVIRKMREILAATSEETLEHERHQGWLDNHDSVVAQHQEFIARHNELVALHESMVILIEARRNLIDRVFERGRGGLGGAEGPD